MYSSLFLQLKDSEEVIEDGQVVDLSSNNSMTSQDVYIEDQVLDLSVAGALAKHPQQSPDVALDLSINSSAKQKSGQKNLTVKTVQKRRRSNAMDVDYTVKFGNYGLSGAPRTKRQMSLLLKKKEEEEEKQRKQAEAQHSMEDLVHAEILISLTTASNEENETESVEPDDEIENKTVDESETLDEENTVRESLIEDAEVTVDTEIDAMELSNEPEKMNNQPKDLNGGTDISVSQSENMELLVKDENHAPVENMPCFEMNDDSKIIVTEQVELQGMETGTVVKIEETMGKVDTDLQIETTSAIENLLTTESFTVTRNGSRDNTAAKAYKCALCSERFEDPTNLLRHVSVHKSEFKCYYCSQVLPDRVSYLHHLELHLPLVKLGKVCGVCGVHFLSSEELNEHQKSHKNIPKIHSCHCGKAFLTEDEHINCEMGHQNSINYTSPGKGYVVKQGKNTGEKMIMSALKDATSKPSEIGFIKGAADAFGITDRNNETIQTEKSDFNTKIENTHSKNLQGEPAVDPAAGSHYITGSNSFAIIENIRTIDLETQSHKLSVGDPSRKCSTQGSLELAKDCLKYKTVDTPVIVGLKCNQDYEVRDGKSDVVDGEHESDVEVRQYSGISDYVKTEVEHKIKVNRTYSSGRHPVCGESEENTSTCTGNDNSNSYISEMEIAVENSGKQYKCGQCPENMTEMNTHISEHEDAQEESMFEDDRLCCGLCDIKLKIDDVQEHLRSHRVTQKEKKIVVKEDCPCVICEDIVPIADFYNHLMAHSVYELSQAQNRLLAQKTAEKHPQGNHEGIKTFVCNLCNCMFESFVELVLHVRSHLGPSIIKIEGAKHEIMNIDSIKRRKTKPHTSTKQPTSKQVTKKGKKRNINLEKKMSRVKGIMNTIEAKTKLRSKKETKEELSWSETLYALKCAHEAKETKTDALESKIGAVDLKTGAVESKTLAMEMKTKVVERKVGAVENMEINMGVSSVIAAALQTGPKYNTSAMAIVGTKYKNKVGTSSTDSKVGMETPKSDVVSLKDGAFVVLKTGEIVVDKHPKQTNKNKRKRIIQFGSETQKKQKPMREELFDYSDTESGSLPGALSGQTSKTVGKSAEVNKAIPSSVHIVHPHNINSGEHMMENKVLVKSEDFDENPKPSGFNALSLTEHEGQGTSSEASTIQNLQQKILLLQQGGINVATPVLSPVPVPSTANDHEAVRLYRTISGTNNAKMNKTVQALTYKKVGSLSRMLVPVTTAVPVSLVKNYFNQQCIVCSVASTGTMTTDLYVAGSVPHVSTTVVSSAVHVSSASSASIKQASGIRLLTPAVSSPFLPSVVPVSSSQQMSSATTLITQLTRPVMSLPQIPSTAATNVSIFPSGSVHDGVMPVRLLSTTTSLSSDTAASLGTSSPATMTSNTVSGATTTFTSQPPQKQNVLKYMAAGSQTVLFKPTYRPTVPSMLSTQLPSLAQPPTNMQRLQRPRQAFQLVWLPVTQESSCPASVNMPVVSQSGVTSTDSVRGSVPVSQIFNSSLISSLPGTDHNPVLNQHGLSQTGCISVNSISSSIPVSQLSNPSSISSLLGTDRIPLLSQQGLSQIGCLPVSHISSASSTSSLVGTDHIHGFSQGLIQTGSVAGSLLCDALSASNRLGTCHLPILSQEGSSQIGSGPVSQISNPSSILSLLGTDRIPKLSQQGLSQMDCLPASQIPNASPTSNPFGTDRIRLLSQQGCLPVTPISSTSSVSSHLGTDHIPVFSQDVLNRNITNDFTAEQLSNMVSTAVCPQSISRQISCSKQKDALSSILPAPSALSSSVFMQESAIVPVSVGQSSLATSSVVSLSNAAVMSSDIDSGVDTMLNEVKPESNVSITLPTPVNLSMTAEMQLGLGCVNTLLQQVTPENLSSNTSTMLQSLLMSSRLSSELGGGVDTQMPQMKPTSQLVLHCGKCKQALSSLEEMTSHVCKLTNVGTPSTRLVSLTMLSRPSAASSTLVNSLAPSQTASTTNTLLVASQPRKLTMPSNIISPLTTLPLNIMTTPAAMLSAASSTTTSPATFETIPTVAKITTPEGKQIIVSRNQPAAENVSSHVTTASPVDPGLMLQRSETQDRVYFLLPTNTESAPITMPMKTTVCSTPAINRLRTPTCTTGSAFVRPAAITSGDGASSSVSEAVNSDAKSAPFISSIMIGDIPDIEGNPLERTFQEISVGEVPNEEQRSTCSMKKEVKSNISLIGGKLRAKALSNIVGLPVSQLSGNIPSSALGTFSECLVSKTPNDVITLYPCVICKEAFTLEEFIEHTRKHVAGLKDTTGRNPGTSETSLEDTATCIVSQDPEDTSVHLEHSAEKDVPEIEKKDTSLEATKHTVESEVCLETLKFKNERQTDIYRCNICLSIFDSETLLSQHCRSSHPELLGHMCVAENCAQLFFKEHDVDLHYATKHNHECKLCLQRFRTYCEFQAHILQSKHYKVKKMKYFVCQKCSIHFVSVKSFNMHSKAGLINSCSVVYREKVITCHQCQCCMVSFKNYELMRKHFKKKWYHKIRYTCSECMNTLTTETAFQQHMSIHRPDFMDHNEICGLFCHTCCILFPDSMAQTRHLHRPLETWKYCSNELTAQSQSLKIAPGPSVDSVGKKVGQKLLAPKRKKPRMLAKDAEEPGNGAGEETDNSKLVVNESQTSVANRSQSNPTDQSPSRSNMLADIKSDPYDFKVDTATHKINEEVMSEEDVNVENVVIQDMSTCLHCNICFSTLFALKLHKAIHHSTSKKQIHQGKKTKLIPKKTGAKSRPGVYMSHNLKHEKIIACEFCGKRFCGVQSLRQHIVVSHDVQSYFACENPDCDRTFNSVFEFDNHFCVTQSKELKLNPELMGTVVDLVQPSEELVEEYILQHDLDDSKALLDKVASTVEIIQNHLVDHFLCKYCRKRFTTCEQLKSHLILQHSSNLSQCADCQGFFCQDTLLEHQRECAVNGFSDEVFHTKKRFLGCDVCFNSFVGILGLTKHLCDVKTLIEKMKSSATMCVTRNGMLDLKDENSFVMREMNVVTYKDSRKFICINCKNEYCNAEDFFICMKARLGMKRNKPSLKLSENKLVDPTDAKSSDMHGQTALDLRKCFYCKDCETIVCYADGDICLACLKHPCSRSETII